MKTVDAKGKLCPVPLIMTKKALAELGQDETLEILIDNETSMTNVCHFLKEYKMQVVTEKQGNIFRLLVKKSGNIPENAPVEDFCRINTPNLSDYVITVKRNRMGDGAEELGQILIKACINTIPDLDLKPKKVIFLNSGIFMCLKDSPVLESLKKLENLGIEILVCGTCLDYYNKKDQLAAGRISNMYDILNSMAEASKVVFA
ncbi:MAG TPA: sulfurtransferase-like selenium metabolism protein YedF [Bacteroidales bacterium]|nr:sulfurtransferase-like selenium metabolism protein YedF [Bacteroidales bacterium]